jgi:hypothetical protein
MNAVDFRSRRSSQHRIHSSFHQPASKKKRCTFISEGILLKIKMADFRLHMGGPLPNIS